MLVVEEWLKTQADSKEKKDLLKHKKFVKQVKVLTHETKLNSATGEKQSSGLGFAEFYDENITKFAIKYLNNMELVDKKGLIVDYSLEDQRAIHKREKIQEKQRLKF